MQDRRYDGYAEHKADHERLLDEIRNMMEQQHRREFRDGSDELAERLNLWFSRHFVTLDARLHRLIGNARPSRSAGRFAGSMLDCDRGTAGPAPAAQ